MEVWNDTFISEWTIPLTVQIVGGVCWIKGKEVECVFHAMMAILKGEWEMTDLHDVYLFEL